jgi:hypothetical protein
VSDYKLDDQDSIPGGGTGFFLRCQLCRPDLRHTQPIQWVPGSFKGVKRGRRVTLTIHFSPLDICMAVAGQFTFSSFNTSKKTRRALTPGITQFVMFNKTVAKCMPTRKLHYIHCKLSGHNAELLKVKAGCRCSVC